MHKKVRRLLRWTLSAVVAVVALVALDAVALAFPLPLFPHAYRSGEFTIRSSGPLPGDPGGLLDDVRRRYAAMAGARPGEGCRIYVCDSQRLYSVFCFLARRPSASQAMGLSVLGVAYLNRQRMEEMAARTRRRLSPSRFDGSLSGAVAHEMAHFLMLRQLGYRGALVLPVWKSEGWADYQAHLAVLRTDTTGALVDRAAVLDDHRYWAALRPFYRDLFEGDLLIEYLAEVEGMGIIDIADASVTRHAVYGRFRSWYDARTSQPPEEAP